MRNKIHIGLSALVRGLLTDKYVGEDAQTNAPTRDFQYAFSVRRKSRQWTRHWTDRTEAWRDITADGDCVGTCEYSRVTSALVGARNVVQLNDSLDVVKNLEFSP